MKGISETALASQVEDLLDIGNWQWMHIKPAMTGKGAWVTRTNSKGKGWLDYLALRPPRILVFELKDETGKMTTEQQEWWDMWEGCQKAVTIEPINVGNKWQTHRVINSLRFMIIPELYLWKPSMIDEVIEVLR